MKSQVLGNPLRDCSSVMDQIYRRSSSLGSISVLKAFPVRTMRRDKSGIVVGMRAKGTGRWHIPQIVAMISIMNLLVLGNPISPRRDGLLGCQSSDIFLDLPTGKNHSRKLSGPCNRTGRDWNDEGWPMWYPSDSNNYFNHEAPRVGNPISPRIDGSLEPHGSDIFFGSHHWEEISFSKAFPFLPMATR